MSNHFSKYVLTLVQTLKTSTAFDFNTREITFYVRENWINNEIPDLKTWLAVLDITRNVSCSMDYLIKLIIMRATYMIYMSTPEITKDIITFFQ